MNVLVPWSLSEGSDVEMTNVEVATFRVDEAGIAPDVAVDIDLHGLGETLRRGAFPVEEAVREHAVAVEGGLVDNALVFSENPVFRQV